MLYKILEYPAIPKLLLDQFVPDQKIGEYPSRQCHNSDVIFNSSGGIFYQADAAITQWVEENINLDITAVGLRYQFGSASTPSHGVHSDATRDYALIYMVDNADGEVVFWERDHQPLVTNDIQIITDYSTITKIESVVIPSSTWYLINGRILHSIENMTRTRVSLQVNIKSLQGIL